MTEKAISDLVQAAIKGEYDIPNSNESSFGNLAKLRTLPTHYRRVIQ